MPATASFQRLKAGSSGQRKSILRNLVSSLIIHESITTTFSKAKAVQPYAERVITMGKKYVGRRDQRDRATAKLYDWKVTLPKLFDTLAERYKNRPGGYTRIHRLPPRYGDMAPLAILELVDGKRDMHFCMTARRVARSQILGTKWLSQSTRDDMFRIFEFRGQHTVKDFDKEVERQKAILLYEDKVYVGYRRRKEEKSLDEIQKRIDERLLWTTSIHNKKERRRLEKEGEEKRGRDAHVSEEELKAEQDKLQKRAMKRAEKKNAKNKERKAAIKKAAKLAAQSDLGPRDPEIKLYVKSFLARRARRQKRHHNAQRKQKAESKMKKLEEEQKRKGEQEMAEKNSGHLVKYRKHRNEKRQKLISET